MQADLLLNDGKAPLRDVLIGLSGTNYVVFGDSPKQKMRAQLPDMEAGRVFSNTCVPVFSPDPGYLHFIVEASGAELGDSLVVSGKANDLRMAKAAGVPCVGVARDTVVAAALSQCHPDLVIASLSDLPDALVKLKDASMY